MLLFYNLIRKLIYEILIEDGNEYVFFRFNSIFCNLNRIKKLTLDMIYETYIPSYPLSEIVDYFWYVNGVVNHSREKILPAGNQELMINLSDSFKMEDYSGEVDKECRKMWFSSILTRPIIIHTSVTNVIGISFKNTGAYSLFGFPLTEFNNYVTDLENVWNNKVTDIRDRILELESIHSKFELLDKLLTNEIKHEVTLNGSVEYAIGLMDKYTITEISQKVGFTNKHLNHLFKKHMGISPNKYRRILQFQKSINMIGSNSNVDLQEIAYKSGYYDQSHFIRDFKEFTDYTPTEFLKKNTGFVNFIPMK